MIVDASQSDDPLRGRKATLFSGVFVVWFGLMILLSIALTLYTVLMWRIALPSFDVVDYHAFLAYAIQGHIQWETLLDRHNGVHIIALPKLLWVLDLWLVRGRGWCVTVVSALAVCTSILLIVRQVFALPNLSRTEKQAFSLLCLLVMSSVLMAECLLSPINSQWSLLSFGIVVLGTGLQMLCVHSKQAGYIWMLLGALLAYFSSAPLSVLLLTVVVSIFLVSHTNGLALRRTVIVVLLSVMVLASCWEIFAWYFNQPLLLALLQSQFVLPEQLAKVDPYIRADVMIYPSWILSRLVFMGQYLLLTLGKYWQPSWLLALVFLLWLVECLRSLASWKREQIFFIFLFLFALILGVGAAIMRFTPLYDYRHANVGFLLGFSSLLLIYSGSPSPLFAWFFNSWQGLQAVSVLQLVLLVYSAVFVSVMAGEAGSWAWEGRNQIREQQIGTAVGVNDPAMFAYVWKSDVTDVAAVEHDRAIFRDHRMGIYASPEYQWVTGDRPLPDQQVPCEYTGLISRQHYPDPQAFLIRGTTVAEDGAVMSKVVFQDDQGRIVGWAMPQLPSDMLLDQLSRAASWGGHLRFIDNDSTQLHGVNIIALDENRRCQPKYLQLPVTLPVQ